MKATKWCSTLAVASGAAVSPCAAAAACAWAMVVDVSISRARGAGGSGVAEAIRSARGVSGTRTDSQMSAFPAR